MRIPRITVGIFCVLATAACSLAQPVAVPVAPAGAPSAVMAAIPAGSMGYVVVHDLKKSLSSVDQYLQTIGVSDLAGDKLPKSLLAALQEELSLGEGFQADKGVAVVMLDPAPFGVDLVKLVTPDPNSTDGNAAKDVKLPLVFLVPGKSIESVFPAEKYGATAEGKYTRLNMPPGPVFALQNGPYILISPLAKALDAVASAKKFALAELAANEAAVVAKGDVSVYVNMELASPLLGKLIDRFSEKIRQDMPAEVKEGNGIDPTAGLALYKDLFGQVRGFALAMRIEPDAVVIEDVATFLPDSTFGKALAVAKLAKGSLLDRLPSLPYILAVGGKGLGEKANGILMDWYMQAVAKMMPGKIPSRLTEIAKEMSQQVTSGQVVLGGAPKGHGIVSLGLVYQCKDPAKLEGLLGEYMDTVKDMMAGFMPDPGMQAMLKQATFARIKDLGAVGGKKVSGLELRHPAFTEGDSAEEIQQILVMVLGEPNIVLRMAAADEHTLVATLGGGSAMLGEAIKTSTGGGPIPKLEGTSKMMPHMPKDPMLVMLLNLGHIYEIAAPVIEQFAGGPPPFELTCKVPLTLAASIEGTSMRGAMAVPTDMVKELVQVIGMAVQMTSGSEDMPPATTPGGEDF